MALKSYLACSALVQARGTNLDYEVGTIPVVCMYYALCVHECVLVALGTIPLLRQHIFGLFLTHPPTISAKYSTERLQNWSFSDPTHPAFLLT